MKDLVLEYLSGSGGAKARDIASAIGRDKSEVNSVLYALKTEGRTEVSTEYVWTLAKASPQPAGPWTATKEQEPVIFAGPGEHLFVEAGPGTGKTDVLVARLAHLTGPGGLSPDSILVLSFSVAAIRELKNRIARHHGGAGRVAFIDIRTFDSFASRFLRTVMPAGELAELDYDERIERATDELGKIGPLPPFFSDCRHVLLDEMQDLVGVRADFARRLLARLKQGFTLFGDSAQGIYDFQLEEGGSTTTSADLVRGIAHDFPDLRTGLRFTRSFRFGGNAQLEKISLTGRTLLLESPEKAGAFLEQQFEALSSQGSTQKPEIDRSLLSAATCVVCRTNGQVLRLAATLHPEIAFRIARDRNEYTVPSWVGRVFLGWPEEKIRRQAFLQRAPAELGLREDQALTLWKDLVTAVVGKANEVAFSAADLRAAVTDRVLLPDPAPAGPAADAIQLSTIHRAKGREFENVIVVMQQDDSDEGGAEEDAVQPASEHRVMFVALTRARSKLCRMEAATSGVRMQKGRWVRVYFKKGGWKALNAFQVGLPRDIEQSSFVRGTAAEAQKRQQHLNRLRQGSSVELHFVGKEKGCPRYSIEADGQRLGMMSADFGWALWHTLKDLNKFPKIQIPHRITNIWVRDVITVTGDVSDESIDRSFRSSGLWLGLELEGLGYCNDWGY